MSYEPRVMLPNDLKDYRAPEGWWYVNRDKVVGVVCAMLFAYHLGSPSAARDVNEPLAQAPATATHATAPGLCLRQQDGLPLRVMIEHQYESGWRRHDCFYGEIDRRDWQ